MAYELLTNGAISTTLASGINSSVTSLTVASASGFPSSGNFRLIIDAEIILVTAVSGTTFTVARAQEGTLAAGHSSGATVKVGLTGQSINQWRADNFQYGPYYSKPSGRIGDMYLCNDAPYILRYDSIAGWEAFGPAWKRSAPQIANFTKIGYTGSYVNTNGHVYGQLVGNGSYNLTAFVKPLPSGSTWNIELGLSWHAEMSIDDISGPTGRQWFHLGLCLYDSVSGNMKTWGPGYYDTFGQVSFATTLTTTTTQGNSNLFGSVPNVPQCRGGSPYWYLRLARNSNLQYSWGRDGFNYYNDHNDTWNDANLPSSTHYGFFAVNDHASQNLHAIFHHWLEF